MASSPTPTRRFTAVVMAGSRVGGDPLAQSTGVAHKALAPVAGVPMLLRVLRALRDAQSVARIVVCGLDASVWPPGGVPPGDIPEPEWVRGGETPATSARLAIEALDLQPPVLITTADHPLLTAETVDEFCSRAAVLQTDVAVGVVSGDAVRASFPAFARRTYRFRDGSYRGCNLYALLSRAGRGAPAVWRQFEDFRKHPVRMVGALGVGTLVWFLVGRLALADVARRIASKFGLSLQVVPLRDPAAGFDVDTLPQLRAAEGYLQERSDRAEG